jgi:hypothetical protein
VLAGEVVNLWFVTPAHGRLEITRHTLKQRAKLCERIGARCVVVAEDYNLQLAGFYGLDRLYQENRFLGRRFNAGVEYALKQGATHITLFDSDSISLDSVYENLGDSPRFHPNYSFVMANGRRAEIRHERWVQTIWPARFMKMVEGQPCDRWINKHVSSSALRNIAAVAESYGTTLGPEYVTVDRLEQVGFQSEDNISNPASILYAAKVGRWASDVWEPLLETYKEDRDQILGLEDHYKRRSVV